MEVEQHKYREFEVIYINPDPRLNFDDRAKIHRQTIDMYVKGDERTSVRFNGYEGVIRSKGPSCYFGFSGPRFEAELDTDKGKVHISYLMFERFDWPKDEKAWN